MENGATTVKSDAIFRTYSCVFTPNISIQRCSGYDNLLLVVS